MRLVLNIYEIKDIIRKDLESRGYDVDNVSIGWYFNRYETPWAEVKVKKP